MNLINKIRLQVSLLIFILCCWWGVTVEVSADQELPLLGENASINLTREIELGRGLYNKLSEEGYIIDDPLLSRYLQDIGESLLSKLDIRLRTYHFYLVKDSSVNAFATPGGYIGVNIGLIGVTSAEDELASVLAHEIAHVELMHSMQMIEKAKTVNMASLISILAAILVSSQDSEAATAILYTGVAGSTQAMINFTRENEYEADRVGVELLKNTDYDPQAMAEFMHILQSREQTGELAGIEYLRTHPVNSNRIAEIKSRLSGFEKKKPKLTRYQQFKDYLYYLYPDDSVTVKQTRFSLALEHTRNGRFVKADKLYNQLILSDPDSVWFNYALAENMVYQQRLTEASHVYKSSLLLYPDDLALGIRLVKVLVAQGLFTSALEISSALLDKHKEHPAVYQLLVKIYKKLDNDPLRQLSEANYHWYKGNEKLAIKQFKVLLSKGMLDAVNEERVKEKLDSR